jgi:hypothetical protein
LEQIHCGVIVVMDARVSKNRGFGCVKRLGVDAVKQMANLGAFVHHGVSVIGLLVCFLQVIVCVFVHSTILGEVKTAFLPSVKCVPECSLGASGKVVKASLAQDVVGERSPRSPTISGAGG